MAKVIALISYYPDTRFLRVISTLSKYNYEFVVVGWDRRKKNAKTNEENILGNTILRLFKLNVPLDPFVILITLPIWEVFVLIQLFKEQYDIIYAVNLDTVLPALIVSKIRRKPLIFDIFDLYADSATVVQRFPFFRKIIYQLERLAITHADIVIIADESRREQIGRNIARQLIVIYNAPLSHIQQDVDKNNIKVHKSSCLVFFGGGVSPDRSIHNMIKALRGLRSVVLVVMGPAKVGYERLLTRLSKNVENVQLILEWVSPDVIRAYTQQADVLFALYDPMVLPNNKYASPNKLFEAMFYKKPIIVSKGTSMEIKVNIHKCGIAVDPRNLEEIKNAVITLCENPKLRRKLGHNGKKAYEKKYNWSIMESILIHIYEKALQR